MTVQYEIGKNTHTSDSKFVLKRPLRLIIVVVIVVIIIAFVVVLLLRLTIGGVVVVVVALIRFRFRRLGTLVLALFFVRCHFLLILSLTRLLLLLIATFRLQSTT